MPASTEHRPHSLIEGLRRSVQPSRPVPGGHHTGTDSEPIWMICEGSGSPAHVGLPMMGSGVCSMCGQYVDTSGPSNVAQLHKRDDILARVERGDFDRP